MRRIYALGLALALIAAVAAPAVAQKYPARTVSVIVPYPAGGSVDGVARLLVQKLNETVGQHFIVENRAGGASGIVGANAVARAAPDGYTLLVSASVHVINPFLYKNLPYDVVKDFTPVTLLADGPLIVVHHAERDGEQPQGFLRAGAQGADQVHLRHHQPRLRQPSGDRAAQARRRPRHAGDPLQGHRAGADRSGERADPVARRSDAVVAAARARRQDQGARAHQPEARRRRAGDSDGRGIRDEGVRVRVVVRAVGAARPAAGRQRLPAGAHPPRCWRCRR